MVNPLNYVLGGADPVRALYEGVSFGQGLQDAAQNRQIQSQNMEVQRQNMGIAAAQEARAAEMQPFDLQQAGLNLRIGEQNMDVQAQNMEIARQNQEQAQAQADAQAARQEAFGQTMMHLADLGASATFEDYQRASAQFPEFAESLNESYGAMDKNRQAGSLRRLTDIAVALRGGSKQTAIDLAEEYADAAENSKDPQAAAIARATAEMIRANPNAALASLGISIAAIDPEVAKLVAPIDSKTEAQRTLEGRAVDGGLVPGTAEYQEFILSGGKSAEKAAETGGVDFKGEQDLRKEFTALPAVKAFSEVNDANERIKIAASEDTPAGDIALIFNYMKMLDPGSVVRETEFATAQNAAGIPERIRNTYNRALSGERLSPAQRQSFSGLASKLFEAQKGTFDKHADEYRSLAKQYGFSPDRIAAIPTAAEVTVTQDGGETTVTAEAEGQPVLSDDAFIDAMEKKAAANEAFTPGETARLRSLMGQ